MVFVTRDLVVTRLHHAPGQKVLYLNNSKVACSTIKRSLWQAFDAHAGKATYAGFPHQRPNSPFLKGMSDVFRTGLDSILMAEWFSVVRNPFVRVLSAYLDKIPIEHRDPNVWGPLKKRFRMSDATPSFADFLDMLLTEKVPDFLDWHFCPQTANLLYGFAPLSFVGQLEAMEETAAWLANRDIPLKLHRPHAKHAERLVEEYYGPREVDAVLRLYETDFDAFGYSRDPANLTPLRPVSVSKPEPEPMRLFLLCFKPGPGDRRRAAFEELARRGEGWEFMEHLRFDAGLATSEELMAAYNNLESGRMLNWRTALKVGQALSSREMVLEAAKALQIACGLMYPTASNALQSQKEKCL